MKKIIFGITSLRLGGAERVLVDLVNKISEEYDITIFTIYANGELEKQLNSNIKLKALINKRYDELSKTEKIIKPIQIMLFKDYIYRKYVKSDYDVEIAFLEGPITRIFSSKNKNTKKIAWVHNDIEQVFGNGIKAKIKRNIDKKIYNKYDKLVFVSKDNKDKFEEVYNIDTEKEVIYNYIDKNLVLKKAEENMDINFNKDEINIVTVSRLVHQKAIDRLINVHTKLLNNGLKHNIYVIGNGPERENLESKIKQNNIEQSFKLIGQRENPYPYIKNADAFALLSYFEGYPMVLLEAQILQKYIIITNTAARETLRNYTNSMIVENDEEQIFVGLCKYLEKANEIKEQKINQEYENTEIIEQVKKLIEE